MSHQATAWAYGVMGLTPAQKLVLYHLANRCNEGHEGYERRSICWPSLTRLETDCELSRRGLTQILRVLEEIGIIIRNRRHGFKRATGKGGESTLYELPLQRPANSFTAKDITRVERRSKAGNSTALAGEHSLPKPVKEPVREQVKPTAKKTGKMGDDEFTQLYQAYPRKKAPKRARLAFQAARRDAPMADIMAGLAAYTKAVKGKKPEFIQHPASWLNGGCWMDRPDGPAGENRNPADARNVYPGLERMVVEFGPAMWNSWLADCRFEPAAEGLRIGTNGQFKADYIRNNFGGRLSELAGQKVIIHSLETGE